MPPKPKVSMATKLYKGEESVFVPFEFLQIQLDAGWKFEKELTIEEKEKELEEKTLEELREEAQEVKINYWHLLGEEKLREKILDVYKDRYYK